MQKIIVMGYVGAVPEERVLPGGKKVTNFSIGAKAKLGIEDVTNWYKINCWGDSFANVIKNITKGTRLIVIGRINPIKTYLSKSGDTKINISISCESINYVPTPKSANEGKLPVEIEEFFKEEGF